MKLLNLICADMCKISSSSSTKTLFQLPMEPLYNLLCYSMLTLLNIFNILCIKHIDGINRAEMIKPENKRFSGFICGADDGTWTRDLRLTKAVHYQLCYISMCNFYVFLKLSFCAFFALHFFTKTVHYQTCAYISINFMTAFFI